MADEDRTVRFGRTTPPSDQVATILWQVYQALQERGYNPVHQIVGYLLSGDPTYITNHRKARSLIRDVERDRLLEELVRFYLENGTR